jgi:hypothetical protein
MYVHQDRCPSALPHLEDFSRLAECIVLLKLLCSLSDGLDGRHEHVTWIAATWSDHESPAEHLGDRASNRRHVPMRAHVRKRTVIEVIPMARLHGVCELAVGESVPCAGNPSV